MKRIVLGALSVAFLLGGCDLINSQNKGKEKATEVKAPGTLLDFASSGVTGNAAKEISAAGMKITDDITTDHQTAFWSLSDIQPSKNYTFRLKVKKDAASKVAYSKWICNLLPQKRLLSVRSSYSTDKLRAVKLQKVLQ
jgi:uncharacterized protein YceK